MHISIHPSADTPELFPLAHQEAPTRWIVSIHWDGKDTYSPEKCSDQPKHTAQKMRHLSPWQGGFPVPRTFQGHIFAPKTFRNASALGSCGQVVRASVPLAKAFLASRKGRMWGKGASRFSSCRGR